MSIFEHLIVIFLAFLFLFACSTNKERKAPSAVNLKKMDNRSVIERSGTKFRGGTPEKNAMQMSDALNRLKSGGGLLGPKGLAIGGMGGEENKKVASIGMPINPYLWRASLESVSFIPLSSADPFGGIIITEWYNDKKNFNERCKINIFVKGVELKTTNLKASIFCQESISGNWIDKEIDKDKSIAFENAILEKAIKFRLANQ